MKRIIKNQATPAHLDGLNEQQKRAVLTTQGPMLVLAGAGTGKTRVVTARIAQLIASGVEPGQILAVTFTKKAATEMRQRIEATSNGNVTGLTVSTFHALGYRILAENRIRTLADGKVNLIDVQLQKKYAAEVLMRLGMENEFDTRCVLSAVSRQKSPGQSISEPELLLVVSAYQRMLDEAKQVDFDDLLRIPVQMLQRERALRDSYQQRWRYILVDEYQDTNEQQHRLLQLLIGKSKNICVVGDDDQSIYGFRGASSKRILSFEREFPGAKIIKLEDNYRSTSEIISLANSIISRAAVRYRKRLNSHLGSGGCVERERVDDEHSESERLTDIMIQRRSVLSSWNDMAVLVRVSSYANSLRTEMRDRGIPIRSPSSPSKEGVTIMTLHRSKGLEFPTVFLPAVEEDSIPHYHAIRSGQEGIEEERRLFYVGVTRARRELIMTSCRKRNGWLRSPSRFLTEIGMY